jgi:hypothetical protein
MISSISNQTPIKELIKLRTKEYIDATDEVGLEDFKANKCPDPVLFYIYFGSINFDQVRAGWDSEDIQQAVLYAPRLAVLALWASKLEESIGKSVVLEDNPIPGKLYWATVEVATKDLNLSYKNADNVHGRYSESNMHDEGTKEYSALYSVETGFVLFGSAERPLEGIMSSLTVDDVVSYKIGSVE